MKYKDKLEYMKFLKNLNVDILSGMVTETNKFYVNKGLSDDTGFDARRARGEYFYNIISPLNLTHTDEMEKTLLSVSCIATIFSYLYLKKCINIDYEYFECPYVNYWHIPKDTAKFCNNYCMAMNYLFKNEFDLDLCISYTLERVKLELTNKNNSNVKMPMTTNYPNFHIHKRSEMSPEEIFMYG